MRPSQPPSMNYNPGQLNRPPTMQAPPPMKMPPPGQQAGQFPPFSQQQQQTGAMRPQMSNGFPPAQQNGASPPLSMQSTQVPGLSQQMGGMQLNRSMSPPMNRPPQANIPPSIGSQQRPPQSNIPPPLNAQQRPTMNHQPGGIPTSSTSSRMPNFMPGPGASPMSRPQGPPMMGSRDPPSGPGVPNQRMGASLNGPPSGVGGPPSGFGGPPSGIGGPPSGIGGPPSGIGGPPSGIGGPPSGIGGPPSGIGGPSSMTGTPMSVGGPRKPMYQNPSAMQPSPYNNYMNSQPGGSTAGATLPTMTPSSMPGPMHQPMPMPGQGMPGQTMPGQMMQNQPMGQPRLNQPPMPGMQLNRHPGGQPMSGPMGGPATGPMGGPQPAKRIDPNQMPNPIQVMKDDQTSFDGEIFATSARGKVPPLVSTKCRIQDDGNCSPRYMRSSVYSIPCNQDMLKESGIPMAIVTTPFAKIPEDEHQLRYVDHGTNGPVRCNRCKAYMNPFMQFIDGGRRFVCNICSHSSEVPQEYFCHLDHQGRRTDIYDRPELCFGSYEFIANADYCKDSKLPSPPAFIFMIDVSYQSIQQGVLKLLSNELHRLLDELPKDVGMSESLIKVGFVTYSSQLHFYNVKANLAQPQMLVVADLEDGFVPLLDGFLVNYNEAKTVVDSLLDMLPEMFKDTRETDVVLGPVIAAGLEALKSAGISGKLLIFHSSLPIAEAPGKLKNREDRKLLNTDKEKTILVPQGNYYMNIAKECVTNGVSIDLFLFPNSYIDVATIGLMVTQTGGQVYRYSYFKEATHGQQFINDLYKNFKREIGFDAIMRLRCSTGLRPVEFFGGFIMNNTTDVELASIDSEKAITIEVKHDDKIPEDGVAFVQNAILYTSASGQRRLRIHNLAFSTCSQLADLYRCCELDTTVNYLTKFALRQVLSSTPQTIRDNLIQKCVQILACYRQHCATPSTSGQLILPECMKLLPLYVNCLIKSDVLSGGSEISSDDRSFLMQACLSMPPSVSSTYLYPRMIAMHTLDTEHDDDIVPDQMRCLGEKLEENGVYLLENTVSMFLWVGLHTDQAFISQVFGVNSIGQLDIEMTQLPELETPLSRRVREIIHAVQQSRNRSMKLTIVRQRDKLEPWFKHYIVEDKGFNSSQLSYVDFLIYAHKEIRNLLS